MIYNCCTENRKAAVLGNPAPINGIDYLEVLDRDAKAVPTERQRFLLVYCLKDLPTTLTARNVLITGGESITDITAEWLGPANALPTEASAAEVAYFGALTNPAKVLVVRVSQWGDFSPYIVRLVNNATNAAQDQFQVTESFSGFDPQLAEVTFSFKVQCGPDFDCAPVPDECAPVLPTPPPINYLAKDYSTFRQVMLDRMNQLLPSWGATSEADMGIMLAELVAYAGDQLSYRQDAVTTEAYLLTARSRISLRRHARLVDYFVSEGCNARVWIQVTVVAPTFLDRTVTRFTTTAPGMPASLEVTAGNDEAALIAGVVVFEPMQDANLFPDQNSMPFHTWGDTNCCLPKGATEATLAGTFSNLQAGDVLIFQEILGPQTGDPADADIRHRCAVRLTAVATQTASGAILVDPLFDTQHQPITAAQTPQPVTEIRWASDDALPFAVCISSQFVNSDGTLTPLSGVSVALGNIVLADHGLTLSKISIGTVPAPSLFYAPNPAADHCSAAKQNPLPVRFRPVIPDSPITQAVPLPLVGSPTAAASHPVSASGWVSLSDANGFTALMVAAADPADWPQYFGVLANVNAGDASQFDLSVVFAPPGGPAGMTGNVVLEHFPGLSLTPGTPNYAGTVLAESEFISVPSPFPPSQPVPASFPTGPTPLPNSGTLDLKYGVVQTYLTVQPSSPLTWPPLFGVVTQGQLLKPDVFNLLVVYNPSSGANGVALPVLVEQFSSVSLSTIETVIAAPFDLIRVRSFEEGPSPSLSASDLMDFSPNEALPVISLTDNIDTAPAYPDWTAAPDLLASGPSDRKFVMEIDSNGAAYLRFGDGTNGALPQEEMSFTATYRVGNGTSGNVGANVLTNFAAGPADSAIVSCTNPLPAQGGVDPETNSQIQTRAPQAFLTQERAVTMQDYVNVVERNPLIEDAAATLRWTGSWYTVFVAAEPVNNGPLTKSLRRALTRSVNQFRLAGQDAVIEPPQYVPLQIRLSICVDPEYFQLDVQRQLMQVLGSGTLSNGQPAYFSPDHFELGQPVYLSPLYAAARAVAGVQAVTATVFEPQGQNTRTYLQQGYIPMGPFQVARLDNDLSLPGNGRLTLNMMGGK